MDNSLHILKIVENYTKNNRTKVDLVGQFKVRKKKGRRCRCEYDEESL